MVDDIDGGPGWIIRGEELRPLITDVAAFRAGVRGDPLREPIELLWTGRPAAAHALLQSESPSIRVRALLADCRRDLGDTARAVAEYDELLAETAGTDREAVIRQHRGKALLAAGRAADAVEDFARAAALREHADQTLRASAEQALARARQLVRPTDSAPVASADPAAPADPG